MKEEGGRKEGGSEGWVGKRDWDDCRMKEGRTIGTSRDFVVNYVADSSY